MMMGLRWLACASARCCRSGFSAYRYYAAQKGILPAPFCLLLAAAVAGRGYLWKFGFNIFVFGWLAWRNLSWISWIAVFLPSGQANTMAWKISLCCLCFRFCAVPLWKPKRSSAKASWLLAVRIQRQVEYRMVTKRWSSVLQFPSRWFLRREWWSSYRQLPWCHQHQLRCTRSPFWQHRTALVPGY